MSRASAIVSPDRPPDAAAAAVRASAKQLSQTSRWRVWPEVGITWAILVGVISACALSGQAWAYLLAIPVIAARQYALLILMHDGFHSLLHPRRGINDLVGVWLIGAACGSSYWSARESHLEHHRRLGTEADPELFLHSAGPPREKRSVRAFVSHYLRLMAGEQVLYTYLGKKDGPSRSLSATIRQAAPKMLPVVLVQCAFLVAAALAGLWHAYFLLWVLPLLTLTVVLNGLRAFCDHANVDDGPDSQDRRLVSYSSSPLERFFLSPFDMNYHAEHHLFPGIPHHNLRRMREVLRKAEHYTGVVQWRTSYAGFVRFFLTRGGIPS